jgi:arylsulfatase A-like enzyme
VNIILVLIDSLNRAALTSYRPDSPIATPNLARFAARAWRFDGHYVGSLPCMPARREIFAGFREMFWRPWGPLEWWDEKLPRILESAGYTTAIVTDHYHYWENPAQGFLQAFQSAEMVRGHEIDYWKPALPADVPVPDWVEAIERWRPGWGRWYYANVRGFRSEADFFPAKVFSGAARWLGEYAGTHRQPGGETRPFFLQVESFDVHEPFHVPEPYASMYSRGADSGRFTLWPPYQDVAQRDAFFEHTSSAELDFIRGQYAGKLTMVDRWFGHLLDTLDAQALWDDTMVIVTTDHGHDLGERRTFGKQYPHYDSHANIPMFVWHPRFAQPGVVASLTSTVDLFATVIDAAGAALPARTHSRSLLPLLSGGTPRIREAHLYGTFGQGVCITDGDWTLFKSPETNAGLSMYTSTLFRSLVADRDPEPPTSSGHFIPGVAMPQWKIPVHFRPLDQTNHLYNRREDPLQTRNLWDSASDQRDRLLGLLRDMMQAEGCPPEQWARLGL